MIHLRLAVPRAFGFGGTQPPLVLSLLAVVLAGCAGAPDELTPTPIATAIAPIKPTYTVELGEVVRTVAFSGRVTPVVQQSLSFSTSGRVAEVLVAAGAEVTAGQVLAALELQQSDYALRRATLALEIAQLGLAQAQAQPDSTQQALDVALKELEVELAQLALDELAGAVAATQLVAPVDGRLVSLNLAVGNSVEAFQPVAVLAGSDELEVSAEVFGETLQPLTEGLPVQAELARLPGEVMPGTIRQLPYPFGTGPPGAEGALTRIALEPGATPLEVGELVRLTAVVEQRSNVLWLPPQAIRQFDGRTFVVVQDGPTQLRTDVEVGLAGDGRVEIAGGLEAGQIILAP